MATATKAAQSGTAATEAAVAQVTETVAKEQIDIEGDVEGGRGTNR